VHAADLSAATGKMDVRINEAGQDTLALCIDLFRSRANPFGNVRIGTHGYDPASVDRECFRLRMRRIDRPNAAVEDNEISGR
jgi:hypothetical protein